MSELIDRGALKDAVKRYAGEPIKKKDRKCKAICLDMLGTIDAQPTIDAVPVVRCKDCKHRDPEDKGCDCAGHEMLMGGIVPMPDNWFCADGERRE